MRGKKAGGPQLKIRTGEKEKDSIWAAAIDDWDLEHVNDAEQHLLLAV